MLKNTLIAIAAVATLGATALASSKASACEYGYGSYGGRYGYGYNSYPSYSYDVSTSQPVYSLPSYGYDVYSQLPSIASQPVYSLPSYDYGY